MLRIESILNEILLVANDIHRSRGNRLDFKEVGDICNDLVVSLIENDCARLGTYDPHKGSLRTWLRVVARNRAKNSARTNTLASNIEDVPPCYLTVNAPQEIHLMRRERAIACMTALEQLDPQEKGQLRMLFELPAPQISQRFGIHPSAIRQRKRRLVQKLRRSIHIE